MTTSKKHNITQHKRSTKLASEAPTAFDIMPRSKIRPSVTSRPVLTSTSPEQVDNTLQSAAQAASNSSLTHRRINFGSSPTAESSDSSDEPNNELDNELDGKNNDHTSKGDEDKSAAEVADELDLSLAKSSAEPVRELGERVIEPPAEESSAEAKTDETDESDETDQGGLRSDLEPTSAEAAKPESEPEASKEALSPTSEASSEATTESGKPASEPEKTSESVSEPKSSEPESEPEPDTVEHTLKDDPQQSIERSQGIKDELQGMDGTEDDEDAKDEHPHHELYGGKPVIIIHKHHGSTIFNWFLWFLVCLLLAVATVDILIDADVITTDYNVPHTNFL